MPKDFNSLYLAMLAKKEKGCTCPKGEQSADCPKHGKYVRAELQREKAAEEAANAVETPDELWQNVDVLGAKLAPTKTCYFAALSDRRTRKHLRDVTHILCIARVGDKFATTRHKATLWEVPVELRGTSYQVQQVIDTPHSTQALTPAFMFFNPQQFQENLYKTLKLL